MNKRAWITCTLLGLSLGLSGCWSDPENDAEILFQQASQSLESKSFSNLEPTEAHFTFLQSKEKIEKLLSDYPDSTTAKKLKSGQIKLAGIPLNQLQAKADQLKLEADAQTDPLAAAENILKKTFTDPLTRVSSLTSVAYAYYKRGNVDKSLAHLNEAQTLIEKSSPGPEATLREQVRWGLTRSLLIEFYAMTDNLDVALKLNESSVNSAVREGGLVSIAKLMIGKKQVDQAIALYSQLTDPKKKVNLLLKIAQSFIEAGDHTKSLEYLDEAKAVLKLCKSEYDQRSFMEKVASLQAAAEDFDSAIATASEIDDDTRRQSAWGEIAVHYAAFDQMEKAISWASKIDSQGGSAMTKAKIAEYYARKNKFEQAYALVNEIPYESYRPAAQDALVSGLIKADNIEQARKFAESMDNSVYKVYAFISVAEALRESGNDPVGEVIKILEQAEATVKVMNDERNSFSSLTRIAEQFSLAGETRKADQIISSVLKKLGGPQSWGRNKFAIGNLLKASAIGGDALKVRQVMQTYPQREDIDFLISSTLDGFFRSGKMAGAIGMADFMDNPDEKSQYLIRVLVRFAKKNYQLTQDDNEALKGVASQSLAPNIALGRS